MRFLIAICLLLSALALRTVEARQPNIIVVLTDDQGYGDISAHGNPILKTPNLDRLRKESFRFTNFHVSPTCAPTRSALLTGRHEFRNGVNHTILERERLVQDAVTLPQVLKSAGYKTGIFGKWHLGDESAYQPNMRGFDEVFIHGGGGIGQTYPGSCGDAPGNTYFNPTILHNGKFEKTDGYCTDLFFNRAKEWILTNWDDGPFFCWIATNAPHDPYTAKPEDKKRYEGKGLADSTANFFGMIHNIDENVGKLLDQLQRLSLTEDTLVIFMNDNGGTAGVKVYNAGMRNGKNTPWLGGTRASSFWRWPGTLLPTDCDAQTAHIDVFKTLAQIAKAPIDEKVLKQVEGTSLIPLLNNPRSEWPNRTMITHCGRWPKGSDRNEFKYRGCAVRDGRYTLVSEKGGAKPQWQLFDIKADPGESKDIANTNPEIVRRLSGEFDRWWDSIQSQQVNDDVIGPEINPFKELYWKQFGGEPTEEQLQKMNPRQNWEKKANPNRSKATGR